MSPIAPRTDRKARSSGRTTEPLKPNDVITVIEGFDAMRMFLETVWERHGKTPEDIAFLLGGSRWVDGSPADPTMWEDWLMAVRLCHPRDRS